MLVIIRNAYTSTPLTAVNDSRQPRKAKTAVTGFAYGIVRQEKTSRAGESVGVWHANARRQAQEIQRSFFDQLLGGREAALALAIAWRDAVHRLVPPVTKRQAQTHPRRNNPSGVSGVRPKRIKGQIVAWIASLQTPERGYSKTFAIKVYGEEGAKEQAIAARQRLLKQYGSADTFVTLNRQATQKASVHFAHLLDTPLPPARVDSPEITRRIQALNQWFSQLQPGQLYVRLSVYHIANRRGRTDPCALVRILSTGAQNRVTAKSLSLVTRTCAQRLPELWQFIENTITAWHGSRRWQDFAARYQQTFMSSTAQKGFRARLYSPPQGYPECLKPPAALLPMLAGFELPALPYWAPVSRG